jgi:hypothetical protein
MYERPWQEVLDFYSTAVNGCTSLSALFGIEVGHYENPILRIFLLSMIALACES